MQNGGQKLSNFIKLTVAKWRRNQLLTNTLGKFATMFLFTFAFLFFFIVQLPQFRLQAN